MGPSTPLIGIAQISILRGKKHAIFQIFRRSSVDNLEKHSKEDDLTVVVVFVSFS
jgi:hypothetical protein